MKAKVYRPELITNFTPVLRPKPSPPLDDLRLFDVLCLTFPAPLMPYLLGVMDIYRWQDRIDGTPEQKAAFTELWNHYQALFAEADVCGDDMPYRLRQSPSNPCVLEQSLDGGLNWSDAFDFSACLAPALRPLMAQAEAQALATASASLTTIMQTYTSSGGGGQPTIDQVAPGFVAKAQETKDLALCQACQDVIVLACEGEIRRRSTEWGFGGGLGTLVLGVVGGIIGAFGGPAGAVAGFAIGAAISEAVGLGIQQSNEAVLNSPEARQDVACCMYNALKGQAPTKANFSASLSACAFTGGTLEAQLAGAIAPLLSDDQVHAAFLARLNELSRWAELGLISCPCDDVGDLTVPFDSPLWTTRGDYIRALATTPVGSFDSFVFDGAISLTVDGQISRVGVSHNTGSGGGWTRVRLTIGGVVVGEDTNRWNLLGCDPAYHSWIWEVSPPLSGTITIEGVELIPGSTGSGAIFCATVTRV